MATYPYISICSGGGGLDLGLRLALPEARAVCYVEREASACAVLAKGIENALLDDAPIWTDLGSFDPFPFVGRVSGVVGGIPCQDFSNAGKRAGREGSRNLWPEAARLVYDVEASWCFFENVASADLLAYYYDEIGPVLRGMGFVTAEGIFSAAEVGAPHLRERFFWLAYRSDRRRDGGTAPNKPFTDELAYCAGDGRREAECGEAQGRRPQHGGGTLVHNEGNFPPGPTDLGGWDDWLRSYPGTEPALRRGADGLAYRADRLRVLGNGVVPLVGAHAFRTLAADLYRERTP